MKFFTVNRKPDKPDPAQSVRKGAARPNTFRILCIVAIMIPLVFAAPKRAEAVCVCCCTPIAAALMEQVFMEVLIQHVITNAHIVTEFLFHELWLRIVYFPEYLGAALAMMTEQMSAISMYQMNILGAFIDAKHQIETQRLFSELTAQAMKDYTPSDSLCTIGSAARSLGQADFNTRLTRNLLQQWSRDRQLLNGNSNASIGQTGDRAGRLAQFVKNYCDVNDFGRSLTNVCEAGITQARRNRDIDYGYTISQPWTLDINFGDTVRTDDEEDVLALASNLYSHDVFEGMTPGLLEDNPTNQQAYLDLRAIVAKRSIAEQSFQAIAAMKAKGTTDAAETAKYLRAIMRELGIATDAEVDAIIGANPSYYAQMEILTQKLFQSPDFFVDLYDKPANAARKGAALEALNLMQENEIFNSALRSEQMMGILLELRLEHEQNAVQNKVARMVK